MAEVTKEGHMEKKGSTGFSNRWVKRFFELKGRKFMYYHSETDIRPKYTYVLHPLCKIEIIPEESKRRPFAFRFRIVWPSEGEAGDESEDEDEGAAAGGGGSGSEATSAVAAGGAVAANGSPKHTSSSQAIYATNGLNVPSPKLQSMSLDASDLPSSSSASSSTAGLNHNSSATTTTASGGGGKTGSKTLTKSRSTGNNSNSNSNTATAAAKKDSSSAAGATNNRTESRGWWASVFGRDNNNNDRHSTSHSGANSSVYGPLELACESFREREEWIEALEQNKCLASVPGDYSRGGHGHGVPSGGSSRRAPAGIRIKEVEGWLQSSHWKVCSGGLVEGVRVFELAESDEIVRVGGGGAGGTGTAKVEVQGGIKLLGGSSGIDGGGSSSALSYNPNAAAPVYPSFSSEPQLPPCYRVNICVNSSPKECWKAVMELPSGCRTGSISSMRIVQSINSSTEIVHVMLDPIFIYPTWTAPRDMCLLRYYKQTSDNSYIVCFDSTNHQDCPVVAGYVRAELHAAYVISPPSKDRGDEQEEPVESLLTYIAQMDPRGWLWRNFGYQHSLLHAYMLHVLDIRDAVDTDRFVKVHFDVSAERRQSVVGGMGSYTGSVPGSLSDLGAGAGAGAGGEGEVGPGLSSLGLIPPPTLPIEMWGEPDATTFKLRGKTYPLDKVKVLSAPSLFKLVAVDVFEVPEPTRNIAANPKNRVFLAQQRGDPAWCFVMNIMVPGPPFLCFVVYLEGDKKLIEEDTPFGRIARPFFYGNDDVFRNNRFKLIPRVVDGNMIIKMAVKDTPTLLGNKLKQYYFRGDNYFELDVDVGSSSVARQVVGLAIGYSKAIEVDMALCLEGREESELSEVIFGGCKCRRVDMSVAKRI